MKHKTIFIQITRYFNISLGLSANYLTSTGLNFNYSPNQFLGNATIRTGSY